MSFVRTKEYADYSDVVFFRRAWFWVLSLLIFPPLAVIIGLTGDVYREHDGEIQVFSRSYRLVISLSFLLVILYRVLGPFLIGLRE